MPLAAVVPLGIIMAALTVTGMGLDASHRFFSGEVCQQPTDRPSVLRARPWSPSSAAFDRHLEIGWLTHAVCTRACAAPEAAD